MQIELAAQAGFGCICPSAASSSSSITEGLLKNVLFDFDGLPGQFERPHAPVLKRGQRVQQPDDEARRRTQPADRAAVGFTITRVVGAAAEERNAEGGF